MTELNKKSLFFALYKETGGLYDPTIIKKFIQILDDWLPVSYDEPYGDYGIGWNDCLEEIRENLK